MSENELFFRQMYKRVHRMQSKNKTDTKVVSSRPPETLGSCLPLIERRLFMAINEVELGPVRNSWPPCCHPTQGITLGMRSRITR
jgi:hypothetical protein